jgi:archaellin
MSEEEVAAPPAEAEAEAEAAVEERRLVAIIVTPVAGVDPVALYAKITSTILSQPEYKLKWDETCKVESGKIYASFTIGEEADFHEEVMDHIEMMDEEVAKQSITFQGVME